jgi:hypothetical protein
MVKRTIDEFIRLNQKKGQHWFDRDTIRFFKSTYSHLYDNKYFISSEKSPHDKRKWSIRKVDWRTGNVETVGEFQQFTTKKQAEKKLRSLI